MYVTIAFIPMLEYSSVVLHIQSMHQLAFIIPAVLHTLLVLMANSTLQFLVVACTLLLYAHLICSVRAVQQRVIYTVDTSLLPDWSAPFACTVLVGARPFVQLLRVHGHG